MKIVFLVFSLFLFSSCDFFDNGFIPPGRTGPMPGDPTPKKLINEPLQEMYFFIYYSLQYTEEEKKRAIATYKYCFDDSEASRLKSICEDLRSFFVKDRIQFKIKAYCYEGSPLKDETSVFRESLTARVYDKEGHVLAEDYLRCRRKLDGTENCIFSPPGLHLRFSLPYFKKAHKVKVIQKKDNKEIILNEEELLSFETIKNRRDYYKGVKCHVTHFHVR